MLILLVKKDSKSTFLIKISVYKIIVRSEFIGIFLKKTNISVNKMIIEHFTDIL